MCTQYTVYTNISFDIKIINYNYNKNNSNHSVYKTLYDKLSTHPQY